MINHKTYLFEFSYRERTEELNFISDILKRFDTNTLTGITILANNNIYKLEFLLLLVFEKKSEIFDKWLIETYPQKKNNLKFNYSLSEIVANQINNKSYNAYSFSTLEQLKTVLTDYKNKVFIFPTSKIMEEIWGKTEQNNTSSIFLSHSSIDKPLVEKIFLELQKEDFNVWFDKFEIDLGDSISDKINEGLNNAKLGILCLSRSFLSSNWAKSEMNYFIQQRIGKDNSNFICLILDLDHSEIPPLLQDYRYITIKESNWQQQLINYIKKRTSV
ncbi:toll/interleukin-1 receptor domain-containing protein [Pedobacter sp. NJ-S-72]